MKKKSKRRLVKNGDKYTLLQETGCKCPFCSTTEVSVFEIHHIDGDRSNSGIENLIILCPTCHTKVERGSITNEEVITTKRILGAQSLKKNSPLKISELEAEFPGGEHAWHTYIKRELLYPRQAQNLDISGTVVVSFIVNPEGALEEVQSLTGHPILRQEAERVIKQSPRWIPAKQNGRAVKAYRRQPVTFQFGQSNMLNKIQRFFTGCM